MYVYLFIHICTHICIYIYVYIYIYIFNHPFASIPLAVSPEDHPLHMTGFLRELRNDEILPAAAHGEGHHGVPHGEPIGTAHQLIASMALEDMMI